MKNLITKRIVRTLIAAAVLACLSPFARADVAPEKGKIYMLTVWSGTSRNAEWSASASDKEQQAYFFRKGVESAKEQFEAALGRIGLDYKDEDKDIFGAYETLSGEKTSPQDIVDKIGELSTQAGENDALVVFIVSHGFSLDPEIIYGEERPKGVAKGYDREHLITPLYDGEKPDFKKDAILRSNLLYWMRAKKHRLDVLITDSCSSNVAKGAVEGIVRTVMQQKTPGTAGSLARDSYALRYLLTHAEGTISWNSSCPCFSYAVGVKQSALVNDDGTVRAPKMSELKVSAKPEVARLHSVEGFFFTNALLRAASRVIINPEEGYEIDDFFQDLGKDYDDEIASYYTRELLVKYQAWALAQAKCTLTAFNVINDHTGNPVKDSEVAIKLNNRVKKVFEHKDVNPGSGKTSDPTMTIKVVAEKKQ